ncbi:MAG: 23S rRNA (adenine(2503)-C(2))-methyltransferase RlmN [Pseudomonadota bacterium]
MSQFAAAFAPPSDLGDGKNLIGLSREELIAEMAALGEKPFRANQLWHWVYHRGETDFAAMTTLSKAFRSRLADSHRIGRPEVVEKHESHDGTIKWLLSFADGNQAETVYIPEVDRGTLCVSSQVGCTLSCRFCHTGTQRLVRNLAPAEIVGQVMLARDHLGEWPASSIDRKITNVVMMGMGEPLYNYENVAHALKIMMDNEGIALSKRKITLSTAGVVPQMNRCGAELGVNLAVSLHATTDELRTRIMPINNKYSLEQLMEACRTYPGINNARRITFEYVMLKDVNDSPAHAKALVKLLEGIPSKINLIPFNPWPGSFFECSDRPAIEKFANIINAAGLPAPVRETRGEDILAACGQLKSTSERARKRHISAATQ